MLKVLLNQNFACEVTKKNVSIAGNPVGTQYFLFFYCLVADGCLRKEHICSGSDHEDVYADNPTACIVACQQDDACECITWLGSNVKRCRLSRGTTYKVTSFGQNLYKSMTLQEYQQCDPGILILAITYFQKSKLIHNS